LIVGPKFVCENYEWKHGLTVHATTITDFWRKNTLYAKCLLLRSLFNKDISIFVRVCIYVVIFILFQCKSGDGQIFTDILLCTFYGHIKTYMCIYSICLPYKSFFFRLIINYCLMDSSVLCILFSDHYTFLCVNTSAIIKYFSASFIIWSVIYICKFINIHNCIFVSLYIRHTSLVTRIYFQETYMQC